MTDQVFQIYDFKLDSRHARLCHHERLLSEDEKLICLLQALVDGYPQAISKQALLDRVWGDVIVSEASLTKLVSEGRRLLFSCDARELIKTVHGKGYRLAVEPQTIRLSGQPLVPNEGNITEDISFGSASLHGATQEQSTAQAINTRSYGLVVLVAALVLMAFVAGAYFLPREKAPDNVLGRWQLIDNNVVLHSQINADGHPFCEDTIEYVNATLIQRNGSFVLRSPLLEMNLGLDINYGEPLNANFSYRDGTGTTHTQLKLTFDGPRKLLGKSVWTWEMDGTGVLCKGISSMVSER